MRHMHPVDARPEPAEDDVETRDLEERAAARYTAIREDVAQLFRAEALDQYQRGQEDEAHLLEVEPSWARHAYRLIVALTAAALLFGAAIYTRFW
jgi:hypothetical protein